MQSGEHHSKVDFTVGCYRQLSGHGQNTVPVPVTQKKKSGIDELILNIPPPVPVVHNAV